MPRPPTVPDALADEPFTLLQARRAGIGHDHLRSRAWRHLGPATYIRAGLPLDPMVGIRAALLRVPSEAAICGLTAAWLIGLDVTPPDAVEVNLPKDLNIAVRTGIRVRRMQLEPGDTFEYLGVRATTPLRTTIDLIRRPPLVEAVVHADAALRARLATSEELAAWIASHPRHPGLKLARRVLELADGRAESPQETRLRVELVLRGLPAPELQVDLADAAGRFLGRTDLYYSDARLAIEYDGGVHRNNMAADLRRQNAILAAGYQVLRFTANDLQSNMAGTAALVRSTREATLASTRVSTPGPQNPRQGTRVSTPEP